MWMRCCGLVLLVLMCQPLLAAEPAEDDCDFDQQQQLRYMQELQKKYAGSHYNRKEQRLEIPRGKDLVSLGIGGCYHYGVVIELQVADPGAYGDEKSLMAAVLALVKDYSQGLIDYEKLRKVMAAGDWRHTDENGYVLNYEKYSVTEVYRQRDNGRLTIGIYNYQ